MNKAFVYSDIFTLLPQAIKMSKLDFADDGKVPAYSADTTNNGCSGYVNKTPSYIISEKNPVYLIFGDHTKTMNIVHSDFCIMDNVKVLSPIKHMTDEELLYITTVWRKAIPDLGYARHWSVAKQTPIELPVIKHPDSCHAYTVDDIDWDYMSKRVRELEEERVRELDAYLKAIELKDCELSDEDKLVLREKKDTKPFVMHEIFEKLKAPYKGDGKKQDNVSKVQTDEYNLPLINCKYNNNGIMYYGRKTDYTYYENVLSVIYNGPPTEGQTYYQEEIGVYTDAYLIALRDKSVKVNREIGLYLTSVVNASIHNEKQRKYSRGNKATWEDKVENDKIVLPITSTGKPDWDFMEKYIRATEKLIIADVVKWKDNQIVLAKKVINQEVS